MKHVFDAACIYITNTSPQSSSIKMQRDRTITVHWLPVFERRKSKENRCRVCTECSISIRPSDVSSSTTPADSTTLRVASCDLIVISPVYRHPRRPEYRPPIVERPPPNGRATATIHRGQSSQRVDWVCGRHKIGADVSCASKAIAACCCCCWHCRHCRHRCSQSPSDCVPDDVLNENGVHVGSPPDVRPWHARFALSESDYRVEQPNLAGRGGWSPVTNYHQNHDEFDAFDPHSARVETAATIETNSNWPAIRPSRHHALQCQSLTCDNNVVQTTDVAMSKLSWTAAN